MGATDEFHAQNGTHTVTDVYEVFAAAERTDVRVPGPAEEAARDYAGEEVQWRLLAIRAVLEREGRALARRDDDRLLDVLVEIDEHKLSIAKALGQLGSAGTSGRDS